MTDFLWQKTSVVQIFWTEQTVAASSVKQSYFQLTHTTLESKQFTYLHRQNMQRNTHTLIYNQDSQKTQNTLTGLYVFSTTVQKFGLVRFFFKEINTLK